MNKKLLLSLGSIAAIAAPVAAVVACGSNDKEDETPTISPDQKAVNAIKKSDLKIPEIAPNDAKDKLPSEFGKVTIPEMVGDGVKAEFKHWRQNDDTGIIKWEVTLTKGKATNSLIGTINGFLKISEMTLEYVIDHFNKINYNTDNKVANAQVEEDAKSSSYGKPQLLIKTSGWVTQDGKWHATQQNANGEFEVTKAILVYVGPSLNIADDAEVTEGYVFGGDTPASFTLDDLGLSSTFINKFIDDKNAQSAGSNLQSTIDAAKAAGHDANNGTNHAYIIDYFENKLDYLQSPMVQNTINKQIAIETQTKAYNDLVSVISQNSGKGTYRYGQDLGATIAAVIFAKDSNGRGIDKTKSQWDTGQTGQSSKLQDIGSFENTRKALADIIDGQHNANNANLDDDDAKILKNLTRSDLNALKAVFDLTTDGGTNGNASKDDSDFVDKVQNGLKTLSTIALKAIAIAFKS